MPLKPGKSKKVISENIKEFHTGKTFAHTAGKFGKGVANKQAVAAALSNARRYQGGTANVFPPKPAMPQMKLHPNRHAANAGQMPVLPQALAHGKRNAAKLKMPPPPSAPVQPMY